MKPILIGVLLFFSSSLWAERVAIVVQKAIPAVDVLAQKVAEQTDFTITVVLAEKFEQSLYDCIVLVGDSVLETWNADADVPLVSILSGRAAVSNASFLRSAIFVEPPLQRQVALARLILGGAENLGILVMNDEFKRLSQEVRKLPKSSKITLYNIDEYDSFNRALLDLLAGSRVLIGQYDLNIYSAKNIENVLITAYRHNVPLIGPSNAYINAGALASTYSDLTDVARRLSEILRRGINHNDWAKPDYNSYFSVSYNRQVARSLNLNLPDVDTVVAKIKQEEQ
ncbi:MAG: hypothetical protein VB958_10525 [Thalassolituus sp.]|uniref:ABC transporter substrate-binding protein n=1 Tax=Thalassolituus sp. TaxID=2030822 RepID=UPI003981D3CB